MQYELVVLSGEIEYDFADEASNHLIVGLEFRSAITPASDRLKQGLPVERLLALQVQKLALAVLPSTHEGFFPAERVGTDCEARQGRSAKRGYDSVHSA